MTDICYICGNVITADSSLPSSMLTRDHIIPKALGGCNSDGNVLNCCRRCNLLKAANPPTPLTFLCIRLVVGLNITKAKLHVCADSAIIETMLGSVVISKKGITVSGTLADSTLMQRLSAVFNCAYDFYDQQFTIVVGEEWFCSSADLTKTVLYHPASILVSRLSSHGYSFQIVKMPSIQDVYSIVFSLKSEIIIECAGLHTIKVQDCSKLRQGPYSPSMELLDSMIKEVNSMNLDFSTRFRDADADIDLLKPLEALSDNSSCLMCGCTISVPSSEEYSVLCPLCTKLVSCGVPVTKKSKDLVRQLYELRSCD